jgi:GT2 family glycosyltransferase
MVAREFPVVRLIRSPVNLGFGIANDRLAATSTATHLLLLNPDTRVHGPLVGPLLAALDADPVIAVAAPRLVFDDGRVQASSERFPTLAFEVARELRGTKLEALMRPALDAEAILRAHRRLDLVQTRTPHDADFAWATCWLLRRADAEATGLFDPRFPVYDEDLDFCSRLRAAGRRVVYVPEVEVVHLGGASSTSGRKLELMRAGRARWYRRHRGPAAALAYRTIVAAAGATKALTARMRGD